MRTRRSVKALVLGAASAVALSGCGFSPYELPLPGGADLGDDPYTVTVKFRDVLDLVPQSSVKVDDVSVGRVDKIRLDGWTAVVTLKINNDVKLPDDAEATLRQTSLLGEKFVSLAPPAGGGSGRLGNNDVIGLDRSGRNPDIEEVLGAASLLLNGGGLEKTNTIVRELNKALDGNEPEVKQLLKTSEQFLGQLDDNKGEILGALEKVNRLAVETNKQKRAITNALDELPDALRVINDQRDDLVGLLQSLDRLSDVATDVIKRSKADTLATLRDLEPVLRQLANAGDSLPTATQALLSFPFTDGVLGDNPARTLSQWNNGYCSSSPGDKNANKQKIQQQKASCFGDYYNLNIRLGLDLKQGTDLISGLLSLVKGMAPGASTAGAASTKKSGSSAQGGTSAPQNQLVDLIEGLAPTTGATGSSTPTPKPSSPVPSTGGSGSQQSSSGLCALLGCRTAAAGSSSDDTDVDDAGRIMLQTVVAR